jgi:Carboxypeptidase regulatory-like domain
MKRKKKIGTNLAGRLSLAAAVLVCALPIHAAKKKFSPDTYSLIAGTVFSANGYALPGAEVALTPDPQPDNAPQKARKLQVVADSRGEFAFRVPPGAMHYILSASAKGYRAAQKPVVLQGEDRVDVTFQLDPESK